MRRFRSPRLLLAVIVAVVAVATGVGILLNSGSDTTTDEVSAGTTPVTAPRAVEPSPPVASRSDPPDQQVDPPETGPERLVVVGGAVLTVPGGWSVFDIDAHPDVQCQLFNHGPALYVGTAPIDIDCAEPASVARPDPGIVARPASAEPFAGDVVDSGESVQWGDLDGWMVADGDILRLVFPEADLFLVQINKAASAEVESVLTTLRLAALLDIAQIGHGFFTEGAFSFIEVTGPGDESITEQAFGPADPIVLQVPVAPGLVRIRAFQRGCPGACPSADDLSSLDPIGMECETTLDIAAGALVRVAVDGRHCKISQLEIPTTTPRRCLPDEVALGIDTDNQPDGALAITTNIENTGPELCEVVLDELDAAITDGSGHLLDELLAAITDGHLIVGNPISTSPGAAALLPGEVLQIVFDWRNSCGDYVAVGFKIDVMNLVSGEVGLPYPKCVADQDATFALSDMEIAGQETESTCRAVIIERVSYPYSSALEALAAELDALVIVPEFEDFAELTGVTTEDFLATLRTDTAFTFRLLVDRDHQWSIRSRHAGEGWGVDTITSCTD